MTSLSKFIEQESATMSRTWFSDLPTRVQNEAKKGFADGVSVPKIVRWLINEGYEGATDAKIRKYLG